MRTKAALGLAVAAAWAAAASAQAPETRWYLLVAENGERVGHASHEVRRDGAGREVVESHTITLQEPNQSPVRIVETTVERQDRAGRTVSIVQHARTGRRETRTAVRIDGSAARVERSTPAGRTSTLVPLPPGTRFDNGEELLAGWDRSATPRLEFDHFSVVAGAVELVVIEPLPGATADGEGRVALLRRRYEDGELRSVARLLVDGRGRVVEAAQPMFGTTVSVRPTDRETALRPHAPFSALRNALVRSPFRISSAAAAGRIRYRFRFRDGFAFPLPETREQRATLEAGLVTLDVCADCGPGLNRDEAWVAGALRATAWLQSDHPRLQGIAAPVRRQPVSDARKMELLVAQVQQRMPRIDFVGHYSALEALSRGAGDCTESAVLLAALGRAAGIPTKVASGLVYSRERYHGVGNVFMPHSWVLARVDGEWRSFDAALDAFDATHIAITIGDGDARSVMAASQLAGLLEWESMSEVRRRPAP